MKILFFAVFLTVMQATPPVPRKATDKPASRGHAVQKDSGDKQAPPAPSSVPSAVTGEKDQNSSNRPPKTNQPESVVVRELPPVTIAADWWNRFYVIFTGLLVAIGISGVLAAYKTLTKIGEQTTATKLAAEAAKLSADALINSERAWIEGELAHEDTIWPIGHKIMVINHGKTAALIRGFETRWGQPSEGTPFDIKQLPNSKNVSMQVLIGSGENKPLQEGMDMAEILDGCTNDGKSPALYYVAIEYIDLITNGKPPGMPRKTSFMYEYNGLVETLTRISVHNEYT